MIHGPYNIKQSKDVQSKELPAGRTVLTASIRFYEINSLLNKNFNSGRGALIKKRLKFSNKVYRMSLRDSKRVQHPNIYIYIKTPKFIRHFRGINISFSIYLICNWSDISISRKHITIMNGFSQGF